MIFAYYKILQNFDVIFERNFWLFSSWPLASFSACQSDTRNFTAMSTDISRTFPKSGLIESELLYRRQERCERAPIIIARFTLSAFVSMILQNLPGITTFALIKSNESEIHRFETKSTFSCLELLSVQSLPAYAAINRGNRVRDKRR